MVATLSQAEARRVSLCAQGFGQAPRAGGTGIRQLARLIDRLHLLQLDSVNVFERSHYLPAFARFGHYDKADLDRLVFAGRSKYTEYWAHEAAVIPLASRPLFQWRMDALRARYEADEGHWIQSNRAMLDWLRAELAGTGPVTAGQIEHDSNRRTGPWWGWSDVKHGLEVLFAWGEVVSAGRTRFERTYALAEHHLPAEVFDTAIPREEAVRQLILKAAEAHGIGTVKDLADYFRIKQAPARVAIDELVDSGDLVPVAVDGWKPPAWMHRDAKVPRRIDSAALLSPFDPVVWERARAERLFGFHYRIEIYTPAPQRVFGYYSLPVLIDDAIVGRIDLKNDRQNRVLRVQSAWHEPGVSPEVAERIAPVIRRLQAWQGLEHVEVVERGNLAAALASSLQ